MQLLSWWMKSSVHQLRLVVYPVIYEGFCTSKRWCRIPSINSMICHPSIPPSPPSRHLGTPPSGTCSDISCTFISWCLLAAERGGNFSLKKTPRVEVLKKTRQNWQEKEIQLRKKHKETKKKQQKTRWKPRTRMFTRLSKMDQLQWNHGAFVSIFSAVFFRCLR